MNNGPVILLNEVAGDNLVTESRGNLGIGIDIKRKRGYSIMKRKTIAFILTAALSISSLAVPAFASTEEGTQNVNDEMKNEVVETLQNMDLEEDEEGDDQTVKEEAVQEEQVEEDAQNVEENNAPVKAKKHKKKNKNKKVKPLKKPVVKQKMISTKKVIITWKAVKGAKGYIVSKKIGSKTFHKVKKVGKHGTKELTAKTEPGKKQVYTVKAYTKKKGKVALGKDAKVKVKTPKVLKQSSKGFKYTNAAKIIRAAKSKLGCSYVSGAQGPRAFDCSGYTYYLYNRSKVAGKLHSKKFVRSSAQGTYSMLRKYNIGRNVKKAQPGDIMLFSRSGGTSGIYHAAIYYGEGKIIHASSPSTGVIITPIAHRKTAAIIRLPKM